MRYSVSNIRFLCYIFVTPSHVRIRKKILTNWQLSSTKKLVLAISEHLIVYANSEKNVYIVQESSDILLILDKCLVNYRATLQLHRVQFCKKYKPENQHVALIQSMLLYKLAQNFVCVAVEWMFLSLCHVFDLFFPVLFMF